jgi:hypothetical protein
MLDRDHYCHFQDQEARLHNNQLNAHDGCHLGNGNNDLGQAFGDKYQ